jgi:hypothetical protein
MRLPYGWLRDVVQAGAPGWDVSPYELENTLIRIGHEVEDVIPVGPVTGPLTVGRVVEIDELTEFKKPIRAVKVDVGEPETRDIDCAGRTTPSAIWWWLHSRGRCCRAISLSPRARPMAAPPTG